MEHFKGTVRIYGPEVIIPKHHAAAMHLADQYSDDGMVMDTMPVERMHQVPKGFGSVIKNLDVFEKSTLVRCIAHQRNHLEKFDSRTRLLGKTYDAADLTMSKSMYVDGLTITKDDFVMLQTTVIAVVEYCGKAHNTPNAEFFLVGTICDRISERRGAAIVRRRAGHQQIWLRDNVVRDGRCWRKLANGDFEILLPLA